MDQIKSWFVEKINKLKHSAPQRKKKKRKKTQVTCQEYRYYYRPHRH